MKRYRMARYVPNHFPSQNRLDRKLTGYHPLLWVEHLKDSDHSRTVFVSVKSPGCLRKIIVRELVASSFGQCESKS